MVPNSLFSSPHPLDFNMLLIFSSKNVKIIRPQTQPKMHIFICLLDYAYEAPWAKCQNEKTKVAAKALNIGEVWNPVCCHGSKTVKLTLWSTLSKNFLPLPRIKHLWYKLAEISLFIIVDQNLIECMMSSFR